MASVATADHERPAFALPPEVVASLNEAYDDSLLLVGRILAGERGATAAAAVGVDGGGVDLDLATPDGERRVRVEFAEPVEDATLLTSSLLGLVLRAREVSGEPGSTSAERDLAERSRIRTFVTSVVEVTDVGPRLRQVTFGGGGLEDFRPCGPDTFLYVLVPPPGRTELGIDETFTWEQHAAMDEADRPVGAYYTLRRWRPDAGELDVLMVLHGDHGLAADWAGTARPGDPVALWGPRTAYHPPAGTDELLLVADETALPAVAVILEQRPPGVPVRVVAEVDGPDDHQGVEAAPGVEIAWLHRDGAEPGTTTGLVDAVRSLVRPGGRPYVWGGGESRAMTAVRRHVRDTWGLARDQVSLVAYWRRDSA